MKFYEKLDSACQKNNSLLCVGLDVDMSKIPSEKLNNEDPLFNFVKGVIDETADLVCAYKPNSAFFEALGSYGWETLQKVMEYIPKDIPVILDYKRGDIGNTARAYAKAAFEYFKADAVTINPFMGFDSLEPFLEYKEKGIFILCLTSNPGSKDFQTVPEENPLYLQIAKKVKIWNRFNNCGVVVGATKPEELANVRNILEEVPILIPGIGAQGGDVAASVTNGINKKGLRAVFNASRSVLYAPNPKEEAKKLRDEINQFRPVA